MGIAAAGIISMQGTVFQGQAVNKDIQVGVQLMQECAELILAKRRAAGYGDASLAAGTSTACSGITLTGYSSPTVTITAGSAIPAGGSAGSPTTISACPSSTASSCKLVSIKQQQGGLTPITLMLVSY
jgi:hypothetical protein